MGFLDQIMGAVKGQLAGAGTQDSLISGVAGLLNDPQFGGLQGLVQKLKDSGLRSAVDSWISTGKNLPVTGDQMRSALGDSVMQKLAGTAGLSKDEVSRKVAEMLPQMLDKLTPNGTLPEGGMVEKGLSMLKGSLLGK